MNFANYYADISTAVFPEGEAENLVHVHKLAVKDALIDLQTKIPCLRTDHADYVGQSSTIFHCGANVFDTVDGNVERVYTTLLDGGCDEIDYTYIDHNRMLEMIHKWRCCRATDAYGMNPAGPNNGVGAPNFSPATPDTDKGYRTRPDNGYWSIHKGSIYVFPSIESIEQIVVSWTGIQRTFTDTTNVPDTFTERDVMNAVESYLDAEVNRRETKDMSSYQTSLATYKEAVGQLIWRCRQKMHAVRPKKMTPPDAC